MSGKEKTNGSLAMAPRVITIPAASQENTRKLRVAAYARVSSNSEDQKHSFAAQNAYFSKLITDKPRLGAGGHIRRSGHHRYVHRQAG